jgi:hypothetical protein
VGVGEEAPSSAERSILRRASRCGDGPFRETTNRPHPRHGGDRPGTQIPHERFFTDSPDCTLPPWASPPQPSPTLTPPRPGKFRLLGLPGSRPLVISCPCALLTAFLSAFSAASRRLPKRHPRQGRPGPGHPCGGDHRGLRQDRNPHEGRLHTDRLVPSRERPTRNWHRAPPWPKGNPTIPSPAPSSRPISRRQRSYSPTVSRRFPGGACVALRGTEVFLAGKHHLSEEADTFPPQCPRAERQCTWPETAATRLSDLSDVTREAPRSVARLKNMASGHCFSPETER